MALLALLTVECAFFCAIKHMDVLVLPDGLCISSFNGKRSTEHLLTAFAI